MEIIAIVGVASAAGDPRAWPRGLIAILIAYSEVAIDEAVASLTQERRDLVFRHLETPVLMGEITSNADDRHGAARNTA